MKKIALLPILALVACAAFSCGRRNAAFTPGEPVYRPQYAAGFTIYEAGGDGRSDGVDGSHVIRITDPWQSAEGVEQWVLVSHEGGQAPENFTGTVLQQPARRIVCMSSSYTAFLVALGAGDRIVGVSGAGFIADPLVRERIAADDVADVGYDGNLDFERLASLQPDLMLMYGVTDDGGVTGKLREMGIPYVFVGEYLEQSPLGRAEWIVALARMCGLFDRGVEVFKGIEQSYNELKARAALTEEHPEVMFNAPYRDVWYVPGDRNYLVQLVRDAGGEYVCRGTDSRDSRPINIEEAWVAMQGADFWINTNHYSTLGALLADNPRFADARPVREGHVYNNNARTTPAGGSDFWESGAVRPDRILGDLIRMFHPEAMPSDTTLYYYKKLE